MKNICNSFRGLNVRIQSITFDKWKIGWNTHPSKDFATHNRGKTKIATNQSWCQNIEGYVHTNWHAFALLKSTLLSMSEFQGVFPMIELKFTFTSI